MCGRASPNSAVAIFSETQNSTPVRQPVTWITTTAISTRNSRSKPASTLFIPLPKKF